MKTALGATKKKVPLSYFGHQMRNEDLYLEFLGGQRERVAEMH